MAINGIKGRKILSEVISSVITSSQKTVQKVGTETQEAAEKMPMPSASNILAYHQKSHPKAQLAQKLSPHEIYSLRKKELTDLAALRQCHERETLHISTFADQDAKKYNRIKEMIYLPLRGNSQISNTDLYKILDLSDEQYEIFSSLISIKGRKDKQFSCYDILEFIKKASKEQNKRAKTLSYIDGRSEQFSFWQIEEMSKSKPEDFEKIKKLLFIPSRKAKQLDYDDISDVMCRHLNDNEFKNLYELLSHNPENSTPYAFCQIEGFLSNNKICKRLQELHCIKGLGDNSYSFPYIEHYAQLPDFQYKVAKRLLHIDKFKDKQLEFSEILEILKQNPEKIKKLLSYLDDKDLNTDSDIFCKLAQCQDTQPIVSMIKRCPHIPANEIVSLFKHSNKKVIEFIKPFLVNPKYNISKENGWICITNKQNNCSLSVYVRNLKNQEYFFERPLLNEKKEIAYIVKTKQGTFMDKWIAGIDESIGTGKNYRKLDNFPEKSTPEKIFSFLAKGDFKTSKVLDLSPEFCGHASFNLPQGSNSCKKVNGALVSELYIPQNKLPQRQTVHYPNGTIKTKDIGIGLSTSLEPNGNNNGMRIRKTLGKEKIDLSSFVEDNYVRIRDNLSGKEYNFSIYEFLEKGECHMEDIEIPFLQKREEVIKLFKKLSPTTLLNLIKYKRIRPKTIFPFIKNASEGEQRISSITLTKSPQITSHETLHGITDILDLPEDSQLIRLHAKEAAKSNGLLNVMSQYATGNHYDAKRGFEELVSIMGTMNEYGTEMAYRADATRLAFPETTKVIEKRLMDYYKRTINEMFK